MMEFYVDGDYDDGGGCDDGNDGDYYRLKNICELCDNGGMQRGEKRDRAQEVHLIFHLLQTWISICDYSSKT